ncbi:hypothetical protein IW139_005473 [Coemansia sp. RSA 353]|nr:hypothetical protein EV181_007675 [Coemansia sp. RSA 532]KAJ2198120.1 hypothetical protein GGH18_001104 [Coemansia sp. RSA 530]KAJ2205764.1 hypothetical protein IW143_005251 [Coemansia sp. RSA 520]KAJ2265872.1 hypothetical protein J3F81_005683 [Coemansia sp. RSA 371]KAJ2285094.1 hypothetical protein IW141_005930 [Coemansia sp. RSA 355]KAJ2288283.1 hypothetical protein IW139_005473 [Coemansia sp. RSA 353]
MIPTAKQALEAELAAYRGYLEQGGLPNMVADALRAVIACGYKYLESKFFNSTTALTQDTAGANNSESEVAILESRLADADAYMRACRTDYANIRAKQMQEVALAASTNRDALNAIADMARRELEAARKDLEAAADRQAAAANRQAAAADRQAATAAATESAYNRAKAEYRRAARVDAATMPVQQPNIFAALTLRDQDMATSTHVNETTR